MSDAHGFTELARSAVVPNEQKVLIHVAAGGCIRTRRDAEDFCRKIEERGWQKELAPVYHATLSLLKDPAAFVGLMGAEYMLARKCAERMRKFYIEGAGCKCLRGPSGSVATAVPDCPVHRGVLPASSMKLPVKPS